MIQNLTSTDALQAAQTGAWPLDVSPPRQARGRASWRVPGASGEAVRPKKIQKTCQPVPKYFQKSAGGAAQGSRNSRVVKGRNPRLRREASQWNRGPSFLPSGNARRQRRQTDRRLSISGCSTCSRSKAQLLRLGLTLIGRMPALRAE